MGIIDDYYRNKALRGGGTGAVGPVTQSNSAAIDKERGYFPNFTGIANAIAGPSNEPRFANMSAFIDKLPDQYKSWDAFSKAGTMSNAKAIELGQPHLSPMTQEAEDYVDGADYDKWADDFTADDIVNTVAPLKPGKTKTPKKQMQKRAAVQKAVAPMKKAAPAPAQRYATVDPLNLFGNKNGVNPFGRRGEAMTNDRFNGGVVPVQEAPAPQPRASKSSFVNSALDLF